MGNVASVRFAMKNGTKLGRGRTNKKFLDTILDGGQKRDIIRDMESQRRNMENLKECKMGSALYVDNQKQSWLEEEKGRCTSIATTKQGVSGDFSVLPATRESGNSEIIQITLSLPRATSEGGRRFYEILKELAVLHAKKQLDYGADNDPFANVRGSAEWGVKPWVGAMIRATDKVKRLQKYARDGVLANEGAEDSLRDLAVYAVIALVLWEQSEQKNLQ